MNETAAFRQIVADKGRNLRSIPYEQLLKLRDKPTEEITVGTRRGTISIIVELCEGETLKIVVQGFLDGWLGFKAVGLDGFYLSLDGSLKEMRNEELYDYD